MNADARLERELRHGAVIGAAGYSILSFGVFHLLNALGWLLNEMAWAIVQLSTSAMLLLVAFFVRGRRS